MRMMHTSKHNMHCEPVTINERLSNVNWAICSAYIPYIPNLVLRQVQLYLGKICYLVSYTWQTGLIQRGTCRQEQVDKSNALENTLKLDSNHKDDDKVLVVKKGIIRKIEDHNKGPHTTSTTQVYINSTVKNKCGEISERLHFRRHRYRIHDTRCQTQDYYTL